MNFYAPLLNLILDILPIFRKAHLEGFGGVEGVIKGKSELYDYLKSNNQFVVVNENDPIQVEKTDGYDLVIPFGRRDSEFYFEIYENNCVGIIYNEVEALSKLTGDYKFYQSFCAYQFRFVFRD